MSRQVDIPHEVLKRGIEAALKEMGAGFVDGMSITGVLGLRPDGNGVLIQGARVTVRAPSPAPARVLRVATLNGERV